MTALNHLKAMAGAVCACDCVAAETKRKWAKLARDADDLRSDPLSMFKGMFGL